MEPYHWNLRVTSREPDRATVFARKHQFSVGAPFSVDEQYPSVTALECALGALGGELVNGLRAAAAKKRLELGNVEASLQATLDDALAALEVVGATGHAGLREVRVKVYAQSSESPEAVQALWQGMLERLPLVRTLRSSVKLDLSLEVL